MKIVIFQPRGKNHLGSTINLGGHVVVVVLNLVPGMTMQMELAVTSKVVLWMKRGKRRCRSRSIE